MNERILVIGIGNEFRGDDGIGLEVSSRLASRAFKDVTVSRHAGDGTSLIDSWQGYDTVILVDAVCSGGEPGEIYRFDGDDLDNEGFPASVSTHGFGLGETVRIARAMNKLPPILIVYGIEGTNFEIGMGLSAKINDSVDKVVERILEDVTCMSIP